MVSQETNSSPRISFSADLDEKNDIPPTPTPEKQHARREEFEFLSTNNSLTEEMLSADELIFEGKLLPFFQINQCEKVNKVNEISTHKDESNSNGNGSGNGWFIDEDPSPRPPSCTVLWKELLKLKKQNSSSTSSSSSSSSQLSSSSLMADIDDAKKEKSSLKRVYKKTTSIRIRPVVNVPICSHTKNNVMPHLFSFKKGKLETN